MANPRNIIEIDAARQDLTYETEAYLRSKGWKHTSSTPGCFWLWERELTIVTHGRPGTEFERTERKVTALMPLDTAVSIQRHLDIEAAETETEL
jgi:hypothetical protein